MQDEAAELREMLDQATSASAWSTRRQRPEIRNPEPESVTGKFEARRSVARRSVWIRGIGGSGHGPYSLLNWQMDGPKCRRMRLPFRWLKGQTNQSTFPAFLIPHVALSPRAPSVSLAAQNSAHATWLSFVFASVAMMLCQHY